MTTTRQDLIERAARTACLRGLRSEPEIETLLADLGETRAAYARVLDLAELSASGWLRLVRAVIRAAAQAS